MLTSAADQDDTNEGMVMHNCRQFLTLVLFAALLHISAGCATIQRVDVPQTKMTVPQARKALTESLSYVAPIIGYSSQPIPARDFKIDRTKVTFVLDYSDQPVDCSVRFASMENLSIFTSNVDSRAFVHLNGHSWSFDRGTARPTWGINSDASFLTENAARKFVDAVLTLKAAASTSGIEEADFAASARIWRATIPKPAMSDDARTYKLVADEAFARKDFAAALDAYCEALDRDPMWPQGQYNTAVLAAETEDYELAAQHMRRYLVLAPDAPDARDAKDKLLLWQHKASQ